MSIRLVRKLPNLERAIVSAIYLDEQPITELADRFGFSRVHIGRIRNRALKKIRRHLEL